MRKLALSLLGCAAAAALFAPSAADAAIVFQSAGDRSFFTQLTGNNQEVGDDITIDAAGPHNLTSIAIGFHYDTPTAPSAPAQYTPVLTARLFTDVGGQPGTQFASSTVTGPEFDIEENATVNFPFNNVLVPDTFHYIVRQDNGTFETSSFSIYLDNGESTVGSSSGNLTGASPVGSTPESSNVGIPLDVNATIEAVVPEPASLGLLALGVAGLLLARRRRA